MQFSDIFSRPKPLIPVIHLQALPGAPLYNGKVQEVYDQAIREAEIFAAEGVDGLIIENFRDLPFYPDRVPAETIAAMATVAREIRNRVKIPIGINVLRNDAEAALAIATAVGAEFIRVNVHNGAALTDQGIVQGRAFATLRKRRHLLSQTLIFADVAVKHAYPLAEAPLDKLTQDLALRSMVDALIVSGSGTGAETDVNDLRTVKNNSPLPVLIGSGTTPSNLRHLHPIADGFIVGSYFKKEGIATNPVEAARVKDFVQVYRILE